MRKEDIKPGTVVSNMGKYLVLYTDSEYAYCLNDNFEYSRLNLEYLEYYAICKTIDINQISKLIQLSNK